MEKRRRYCFKKEPEMIPMAAQLCPLLHCCPQTGCRGSPQAITAEWGSSPQERRRGLGGQATGRKERALHVSPLAPSSGVVPIFCQAELIQQEGYHLPSRPAPRRCSAKSPTPGGLSTTEIHSSQLCQLGSPRSRCWSVYSVSSEGPLSAAPVETSSILILT